jgi:hypothetical protein
MLKWLGITNLSERGLEMGTKLITIVLFLFFLFSSSPTHANLIKLYDLQGTIGTPYDNLTEAEIYIGSYDILGLARIQSTSFNDVVELSGYTTDILIAMLNRTYVPFFDSNGSPWGDPSNMYVNNRFEWQLMHWGVVNEELFYGSGYGPNYLSTRILYDLSGYDIECLYINSSFIEFGTSTGYKFDLLAEVEPIPEPSTMTMLGVGLLALIAYRRKRM